jgi:hypothetical protein
VDGVAAGCGRPIQAVAAFAGLEPDLLVEDPLDVDPLALAVDEPLLFDDSLFDSPEDAEPDDPEPDDDAEPLDAFAASDAFNDLSLEPFRLSVR